MGSSAGAQSDNGTSGKLETKDNHTTELFIIIIIIIIIIIVGKVRMQIANWRLQLAKSKVRMSECQIDACCLLKTLQLLAKQHLKNSTGGVRWTGRNDYNCEHGRRLHETLLGLKILLTGCTCRILSGLNKSEQVHCWFGTTPGLLGTLQRLSRSGWQCVMEHPL